MACTKDVVQEVRSKRAAEEDEKNCAHRRSE